MKILAFDMDDTVCNTTMSIIVDTIKIAREMGNKPIMRYIVLNYPEKNISQFDDWVGKFIFENVIIKRTYMDTAEPSELFGFNGVFKEWLTKVKKENEELKAVICTHRGDNTSAWMSSYNWLNKRELMEGDLIDFIHSINSQRQKNKIEYLKNFYGTDRVLLVDDNPFGSTNTVVEYCRNVLIYNNINKYKSHANQDVFTTLEDLRKRVSLL